MPGADYQHSADPVHSKASRDGEPRPPRTHKEHRQKDDPRDRNRREELQGPGDRSSLPPGSEYHPPEQRRMQDRHSRTRDQERARDGKEVNRDWSQQQRHVEDRRSDREEGSRQQRNMDDKIPDREDGSRDRYREDRSRDRYREDRSRDRYREDRSRDRVEKSRYQEEGTQDRHWEDRSQDKHWEKSRSRERDRYREERGQPLPRDPKEMNFHQESTYYNKDAPSLGYGPPPRSPTFDEREYYESQPEDGILECNKCRYLCTGRGVLQILEVVLIALVLICIISSYFVLSGLSSSFTSGGFGSNYPFEGQELQQVRQLDQQFTVMRAPLLYGGLAFCIVMGALTFGVLAAGSKRLQDLSRKWLLFEAAFSILAFLGCGAAVGIFLHFALEINSTDVCKRRERLYARNGLTWMNCNLAGTDGAAATFAILLIMFYVASLVLAVRSYREQAQCRDYPEGFSAGIEPDFPNRY